MALKCFTRGVEVRLDEAFKRGNFKRVPIPRDGLCIVSAWRYALHEGGYEYLSINDILKALRQEVLYHASVYEPWVTGDLTKQVLEGVLFLRWFDGNLVCR